MGSFGFGAWFGRGVEDGFGGERAWRGGFVEGGGEELNLELELELVAIGGLERAGEDADTSS